MLRISKKRAPHTRPYGLPTKTGLVSSRLSPEILMLENRIERRLVQRAKEAGGMAIKWVAPAMAGVPDRIVFLPGGVVIFVELKAPGKQSSPLQVRIQQMLKDLGADVRVLDSLEAVDALFA
jgi:hypothetical protein